MGTSRREYSIPWAMRVLSEFRYQYRHGSVLANAFLNLGDRELLLNLSSPIYQNGWEKYKKVVKFLQKAVKVSETEDILFSISKLRSDSYLEPTARAFITGLENEVAEIMNLDGIFGYNQPHLVGFDLDSTDTTGHEWHNTKL